jgi:hypothetical protein
MRSCPASSNYNGRFAKPAARDQDFHRSVDPRQDLDQILCWRESKTPRRVRRRSDMVASAAPAHAPSDAAE